MIWSWNEIRTNHVEVVEAPWIFWSKITRVMAQLRVLTGMITPMTMVYYGYISLKIFICVICTYIYIYIYIIFIYIYIYRYNPVYSCSLLWVAGGWPALVLSTFGHARDGCDLDGERRAPRQIGHQSAMAESFHIVMGAPQIWKYHGDIIINYWIMVVEWDIMVISWDIMGLW